MTTELRPPPASLGETPAPDLALPPELAPLARKLSDGARGSFRVFNRWLARPMLRAGLGAWMGTPIGGWILLLRVRGRKSGLWREVPLSYLVADGSAWVMAGFGARSEWYLNLIANPAVEVVLPGRTLACRADIVGDPQVRAEIIPRLVRACGLPGYLAGADPFRAPPHRILTATSWVPLIRLRADSGAIVAGPDDPGGLGWLWRQAVVLVVGVALARRLRALVRRG